MFDNLDYPPGAFLVLWPLSLVSDNIAAVILPPLMVLAAAAAALILVWWFSSRLGVALRWQEQAALVAMVLTKRRDVVLYAVALVLGQTAVFAATVGGSMPALLARYAQTLASMYNGPDAIAGLLSIRWQLEAVAGNYVVATILYVALAAGSVTFLASVAIRSRDPITLVQLTAASLLWSLLFLPHQLYNGILTIPAIWLLMWPESGLVSSERARVGVVMSLILFRVVDVPRLLRFLAVYGGFDRLEAASYWLRPMVVAALFAFLLGALSSRANRAGVPAD